MELSEPAYLTMGGHTFMVPLGVENASDGSADGFISWSAIRNNILVFNPDRHLISAVTELPEATAGWIKLKVLHTDLLELEIPLTDGKTGTLVVDTGSPIGISLAKAPWSEWKAAHPKVAISTRQFIGPQIGNGTTEEAWADKLQLGPITFSDLPVTEAPLSEESMANHFTGLIGLYALTRMDLVVDAKNEVAYIQPRDPPGPPYPPFDRPSALNESGTGLSPNWTLDSNVQSSVTAILIDTARIKATSNDLQGALVDLNYAIELNPDYADAYPVRGAVKISLNDWEGALADFTHCIELDPKHAYACYYFRGVESESQGHYEEALADYSKEIELNSTELAVASLHRESLLLRLNRPAEDFAKTIADWKDGWTKTLGQLLTGNLSEEKLFATAAQGTAKAIPNQQCSANYFVGLLRLLKGDSAGAHDYWQKAAAVQTTSFSPSQYLARAELARLDGMAK